MSRFSTRGGLKTPQDIENALSDLARQMDAAFDNEHVRLRSFPAAALPARATPAGMLIAVGDDVYKSNGTSWEQVGGGGSEFADDVFRVVGSTDATKEVAFEVDGLTTATTRTITVPDVSGKVALFDPAVSLVAGDILYSDTANRLQRLAKGTAAQVLQMNAGATAPEWATASSGGGMTLLGTLTTTSGTTHALTGLSLSTYRHLWIEIDAVSFTGSAALSLAYSATNGAAYGAAVNVSAVTGAAANALSGSIIGGLNSTVIFRTVLPFVSANGAGPGVGLTAISADTTGTINAIRVAGGTFDAGVIRVYGVK